MATTDIPSESANAEVQELRQALEAARHALVTTSGAYATDRPALFNFDAHPNAYWVIDHRNDIAAIDKVLDPIER